MKLEQIQLPVTNRLLADYIANEQAILPFFEYRLENNVFEERAKYLKTKEYKYGELASVIRKYMQPFGISEAVEKNLLALADGAFAIVGGQQAGILTGPLYSVHKAITTVLLANEQQRELNIPVVPLFWIAGEDHDIEEINHTYTIVEQQLRKRVYSKRSNKKLTATETIYDKQEMTRTIRQIFADFGETTYTESLLAGVLNHVEKENTFTGFFTALMNELFGAYGLLMIDAANPAFRAFEKEYFVKIIEQSEAISKVVVAKEADLQNAGYGRPIEASLNNVNLFYVKDGERFLLEWHEGVARNTSVHVQFTKAELIELANNHPECLSNNVVTRPLMQEMTIPVLSFVGGPGELAYWATLKPAFEQLQLKMPIFTPRLHISLVSRKAQSILDNQKLTVLEVMTGQAEKQLTAFIASIQDEEAQLKILKMQNTLTAQYEDLLAHMQTMDVKIDQLVERNKNYHNTQFDYLRKKIAEQIELKHVVKINQFKRLQNELRPFEGLQERSFNPYMLLNEYGQTLIDELLASDLKLNTYHNVLYL